MRPPSSVLALASALGASLPFVLATDSASACGGFFARGPDVPALEVEQTLIIHDPVKQVEHFIREVTFRKGTTAFGFVVPTPTRPEVAKVDDAPFARLDERFPMMLHRRGGGGGLGAIGSGSGAPGGSGVEVLSTQKLGSFTAFVLAATDAAGLKGWLTENHFETTRASQGWLEHYVKQRFHFVAFRFDPPAPGEKQTAGDGGAPEPARNARATSAETMRISFPTPVPYYPYLEPDHAAGPGPRVLGVWFISPAAATPVAALTDPSGPRWKRPWLEGFASHASPASLEQTLGPSLKGLLPPPSSAAQGELEHDEPSLSVQVFEDQKKSRKGFGDVVLVPNTAVALDEAELAKRRPFFAILDPRRVTP